MRAGGREANNIERLKMRRSPRHPSFLPWRPFPAHSHSGRGDGRDGLGVTIAASFSVAADAACAMMARLLN